MFIVNVKNFCDISYNSNIIDICCYWFRKIIFVIL